MKAETELRVSCACHAECIVATKLDERDGTPHSVELAFWKLGQNRSPTWRFRLSTIWRVLRWGDPYEDFVLLDRHGAKALAMFLLRAFPVNINASLDSNTNTAGGFNFTPEQTS